MENKNICQSCTMPLDDAGMMGTEKDGSLSQEYCRYCYQHGSFVNPGMSLQEMIAFISGKMEDMKMPSIITEASLKMLPQLKRWKSKATIM